MAISRASLFTTAARCSSSSVLHTGAASPGDGTSRKLSCCMAHLLRCRRLHSIGSLEPSQQSIHHRSSLQQVGAGAQRCQLNSLYAGQGPSGCGEIGPRCWNQRACAVGQHQCQVQLAAPMAPAQHIERHALKGVALANNRYLIGIIVEVVGSLSSGLLIPCITDCYSRASANASPISASLPCFGSLSRQAVLIEVYFVPPAKGFLRAGSFRPCCPTSCCMSSIRGWKRTT